MDHRTIEPVLKRAGEYLQNTTHVNVKVILTLVLLFNMHYQLFL